MTDCPRDDIRDLLPDLVHERLDETTRALVVAHVEECESCGSDLALVRTAMAALRRPVAVNPARIASAVRRAPVRGRQPAVPTWAMPIAAAILALLTGVLALAYVSGAFEPGAGTGAPDAPLTAGGAPVVDPTVEVPEFVYTSDAGLFVGGLADLDDSELESMLQTLETLEPWPGEEPGALVPALEVTEG